MSDCTIIYILLIIENTTETRHLKTKDLLISYKIFLLFWHSLIQFHCLCINKIQQDATNAGIYLLHNYSTCFGCLSHPSLSLSRYYDLYQKLLLQFGVLLMMDEIDTRSM